MKLFCNVDRIDEDLALRALKSLYGMDIQESSVFEAREHLLKTLADAYKFFTGEQFTRMDEARAIVEAGKKFFWNYDELCSGKINVNARPN